MLAWINLICFILLLGGSGGNGCLMAQEADTLAYPRIVSKTCCEPDI
ncbi:MAG: hypothetical protein AAF399_05420 [Bacteroidota bacterium]